MLLSKRTQHESAFHVAGYRVGLPHFATLACSASLTNWVVKGAFTSTLKMIKLYSCSQPFHDA